MSNQGEQYDADYFLRGKETGKSLYRDYRWLPELTIPMVTSMVSYLGIEPSDTVLDFGCARGYTVRAFRELGYICDGFDVSKWAIDNCDPMVKDYVSNGWGEYLTLAGTYDWIIAKDVLEHVVELAYTIEMLMDVARKGIFVVVPLATDGRKYDVPEYELDVTHVHRRPLSQWAYQFYAPGWSVAACYRVPGVKDNYAQYLTGNGFLTCRRL